MPCCQLPDRLKKPARGDTPSDLILTDKEELDRSVKVRAASAAVTVRWS